MIKPVCIPPEGNNKEGLHLVFNKTHLPACISNAQKICATGLETSHSQKTTWILSVRGNDCEQIVSETEEKGSTCSSYNDNHPIVEFIEWVGMYQPAHLYVS